jgi:signal transduction histidine kinase
MTNQDDFISTVSHELRTPLTSIRGFAQTMLTSWDKLDDNSKKKFLEIIEQQSNRLIHLVENILSVTKIADEKFILKKTNPNPIITAVVQIVKQKYTEHTIITEFQKDISAIATDTERLQQIFLNVIENACKYSEPQTTVKIRTLEENNRVVILISDEGMGIDKQYAEKIFQKFSRIDNPLTRKIQGSGLGLYITKTLVEKMNGTITFKSLEKGTEFRIEFPSYDIEEQIKCCVTS